MIWTGILIGSALSGGLGVLAGGFGFLMVLIMLFAASCMLTFWGVKFLYLIVNFAVNNFLSWKNIEIHSAGKRFIKLVVCGVLVSVCLVTITGTNTGEDIPATEKKIVTAENKKQYDALQKIFISLNSDTTEADLKSLLSENTLPYSVKEYSGRNMIYIVAFDEEVTPHRHAKAGDYVEISFDKNGLIRYGQYVKNGADMSALYYNYGTWWYLNERTPLNKYSGYYNIKYLGKEEGITIVYSNGNSINTHYHPCASAEEAVTKI